MPALADPKTAAGPLRAEDLDRAANPGRIYHLHRVHIEPQTATDDEAEALYRQACAAEGGQHADPVPSATHRDRPGLGIALIALPWALAVICWAVLARLT